MIKKNSTQDKTKEEKFREIVTKAAVCQSQICPMRTNCLRSILRDLGWTQEPTFNSYVEEYLL